MATMSQIKALLKMHFEGNDEKFKAIALQIAAHEAKNGHTSCAREIKDIVQNPKYNLQRRVVKFPSKNDALEQRVNSARIRDLVLDDDLLSRIIRILTEYKKKNLLRKNGLANRNKVLLVGAPGTGKTMTASVIANELALPLYVIQIDKLVTKYMGETSVKLRQVFDQIAEIPAVYLFDEFDAIGSDRMLDNDVGEMRRILNSFLQYLENDESSSIIVAATNNPKLLDKALFRRFDDVLEYNLPNMEQIEMILKLKLTGLAENEVFQEATYSLFLGLPHADVVRVCDEAIKYSVIDEKAIDKQLLDGLVLNRKSLYCVQEA